MKKLLGGIFARSASAESPRAASTPAVAFVEASAPTPKRWGAFLLPSTTAPSTADQVMLTHLDAAMRGIAAHVKAVIARIVDGETYGEELQTLVKFVEATEQQLQQQSCEASLEVLRSYFSSPEGFAFCERTAFPSLVLDFISKMRAFATKEELREMMSVAGDGEHDSGALKADSAPQRTPVLGFGKLVPSLELLMNCVVAIASSEVLMNTFRCELPNLLALTAEEYPPMARFIRDASTRALISIPEGNFNAGLAWYLLDCNAIAKTIQLLTNYALATVTTPETAARALQIYQNTTPKHSNYGRSDPSIDDNAAAAAVSEALGLSPNIGGMSDELTAPTLFLQGEVSDTDAAVPSTLDMFCLPCYDVRVGLKAVIYVLENTYRFTLVLLDEFQTSGGYTLLLRLLDACSEEEIPTLLDLLTSLIPLGSRSSDSNESSERFVGGNMLCARNANAFATMRDLLLNYVAEPDGSTEVDKEGAALLKRRNEHLILLLLTNVLHIYTSDYDNFVFLEPKTRLLALLLTKLPFTAFYDAQVIILRVVEYVCCSARPDDSLPHDILSIVCGMLVAYGPLSSQIEVKEQYAVADSSSSSGCPRHLEKWFKEGPGMTLSNLMCECLIKILRTCEAGRYKQELSGFGLMERGIYLWLEQIAICVTSALATDKPALHELLLVVKPHLEVYGNLLYLMLRENPRESIQYRESRIHESLYAIIESVISGDLLSSPFDPPDDTHLAASRQFPIVSAFVEPAGVLRSVSSRGSAFVLSTTLLQAGIESDLSFILELLQRFREAAWRQILLLYMLIDTLKVGGSMVASSWRGCQGYENILALLSSIDLAKSDTHDRSFQVMDTVLRIINITLSHNSQSNIEYFKAIHGYSTIASCIITSGTLDGTKKEVILQRILELVTVDKQLPEIRNGDAVQIIFCLLPILPLNDAIDIMKRLLSMLETAGDTSLLRRKEQIDRLIRAGALQWIQEPKLIKIMMQYENPLRPLLSKWIMSIVLEEDLTIPRLQQFMELVGKMMPKLLESCNTGRGMNKGTQNDNASALPEIGLILLRSALRNPAIRHISVGKPHGTEQTGRYVHIVNSTDRVWPPPSGYSFSCWLRFPSSPLSSTIPTDPRPATANNACTVVSVALCEGYLSVTPDAKPEDQMIVYSVLVDTTLTIFRSSECAAQNQESIAELEVSSISRIGPLDWSFASTTERYLARCANADDMDMWWRAITRSRSFVGSNSDLDSDDILFASFGDGATPKPMSIRGMTSGTEEGSACIVSIYSLESSGCFVRAFFEQSTGFLRFHTGAVSSGPSINANPKRTSVVFESVAIDDLRPSMSSKCSSSSATESDHNGDERKFSSTNETERKRDWHHFAFTHRKSVVGSSSITVYIDGMELTTKKLNYPSAPSVGSFQAFVGSDAQVCSPHSALSWKAGPMWLTDEVVSSRTIAAIFSLGPTFAHQFSGHAYRSIGDWPEALAGSHLARAADRGIAVLHFSQRLQLTRLGQSCRPHWRDWNQSSSGAGSVQSTANDTVATSAALIAESMIAKKDELTEGLRLATGGTGASSRKMKNKVAAFRNFISYDCALSSFGSEIESLLVNSKLPEDTVLFTLNSSCSDRSNTSVLANTQAHYINCAQSRHLDMARSLPYIGGIVQVLFPLLENASHQGDLCIILKMLVNVLRRNPACLAECIGSNGYAFITSLLCKRVDLINEKALRYVVRLAVAGKLLPYASGTSVEKTLAHPVVVSVAALTQVVLSVELRKKLPHHLQCQLVALLMDLLVISNPNAVFNARQLRRAGLLQWILTYLSELGNEECEMNTCTALEMRWCFPKFSEPTFEAILQYALSLLRAYLRIESHVDDLYDIAEMLLLSMAGTAIHSRDSPIRVLLLQFLLHEIENDSNNETIPSAKKPGLSATIIEAILHREGPALVAKKRDDRRVDNGNTLETASLGSPIADNSSKLRKSAPSPYPVDGFASILLDMIDQESDRGRWVSTEALLAIRILFALAQLNVVFAEHLLSKAGLALKLKRALPKYSTDYCAYIPLLAYVFGIPVGETSYCDPDTLSTTNLTSRSFSSPHSLETPEKGADQVWDLIGDLLQQNCLTTYNSMAVEINVNMIGKIAYQVDRNAALFADLCKSSATLFRVIVQCLCSGLDDPTRMIDITSLQTQPSTSVGSTDSVNFPFQQLIAMTDANVVEPSNTASSCVHLTQTIMIRALAGSDEFGSLMMLFLETLEEQLLKQEGPKSRFSGQRFWLALLNSVIDKEEALTTKCTLVSMKNVCTVCVALARYLAIDENHLKGTANTDEAIEAPGEDSHFPGVPSVRSEILGLVRTTCFGEEVFRFFMKCCKQCTEPATTVSADQQQFFYGTLVYSAQTVLLNELGGTHIDTVASPQILDYLVEWKHVLLQQPNWQGLVSCGTLTQSPSCDINQSGGTELNSASIASARPRRLHRVRSLSANAHKEFGLGTESDRCFILSLASVLFKMLMDDEATVRHKAIVMWQFLIDQRFSVLKELLIAEPRTSLLHTITSTKKEAAVDIFHGGFDRLLYALHTTKIDSESEENTNNARVNQEIWCQFQLWLAENNALLTDLLVTRTESICRHIQDVLLSCSSLEMVPSRLNAQETLDLNFPVRLDVRKQSSTDPLFDSFEFDSIRREMIAKKAAMKFSSFRDSALESMNDGLSLWQETSLRLACTRNIWRTGRWQTMLSDDHENSTEFELEPQRSLFQRRSFGYRLDTTEGPQRMRLRLIQDCSSDQRSGNQFGSEDTKPTKFIEDSLVISQVSMTSNMGNLENDTFRRGLEFHEAVDVFREFVYRQSIAANDVIVNTLEDIMRLCKLDSTRKLFSSITNPVDNEYANGEVHVLTMARLIYASFLVGKSTMGISPTIVSEIRRFIEASVDHPEQNPIQSTLFDAADAEATQYALCSVREESIRSIRLDMRVLVDKDVAIGGDCSDDEAEEEVPVESGYPVDDVESDDSDGPPDIKNAVENEIQVSGQENVIEAEEELGDPVEVSLEPTSPKAEPNKHLDTSSDAAYGAITRFLRVDDYPPTKSYNATYITGMGGTAGLLVLCRSGLYFIGGYTKINNDLVAGTEQGVADSFEKPTPVFFNGDGEQASSQNGRPVSTPTSGRKKTPKTFFRAALTDLGFSQPKPGSEQFFTVVPLAELPAYFQRGASSVPPLSSATSFRWSIKCSNIKQFCRIKYQLRPVGIEFFDTFGSTYFLQLENATDREEVVKLLFQMPLINSIFWSPVFRTGSLVPSTKRIRQAVTKRWLRGSISNFEYLIHLNTLAGRSFNDITQYPVFPWVIADYNSEFLDLDARDTFRDLSKPMGAIGKTRAAQFSERYAAMCQDMDTEELSATPAFHYGTHYSCSAYVINYLIRLEPFTAFALELQGGSFDHPDRLFRSVASSWASASRENLQDVRELIPEFFYLPEFLYNANNCSFGATQSGEEVCHVNLPPWAHGDPREFVRLNRRALESKYVSEHLHQWIDLVFGVKQTGQAAVDAQNVFMHFTYEGTVDIDQISDPVMRAATLAQIENFGQTPSRLFSSPHPQRKVPTLLAATPPPLQTVEISSVSMLNPSVGHQYDGITLSTIEAYVKWHTSLAPALVSIGKDYVFLKRHSAVLGVTGGVVGDVKLIHDKMQCQGIGCTFMPPRFAKYLDWGNNGGLMKLRVHQQSTGRYRDGNKVLAIIEGAHHDNVNCVSISDDGSLLVTGGNDAVVNLIECSKTSDGRRIFKQAAKFVGHTDSVVYVAINKDFNLIASSSADRCVLLWDLRTRALLQELAGHAATVTHVSINGATGNVLTTTFSEIRLWSINGDLLAASSSPSFGLQAITCAISTRCEAWQTGVIAVTGHANGAIALWGVRYPADLARQKKDLENEETVASLQFPSESGVCCTSPITSKRTDATGMPVSISTSSSARKQVIPSCQLFILKLLLDHRAKVTALTLGPEQRQLLSGDAEGNCIRWVDDSISTNIH